MQYLYKIRTYHWNRKAPTHFVPAADIKSFLSFAAPASSMPLGKNGFAILQTLSY